jgi:phosphoserine phosphatase RsbU/P
MFSAKAAKVTALDKNPVGNFNRRIDQPAYQSSFTEVLSGNNVAHELVTLPGLAGFIHSKPAGSGRAGGDVYYSVCRESILSRVVLADVAGHGEIVAEAALMLQALLRKHINTFDQSALMREINEAFRSEDEDFLQFATAAVLSYYSTTGVLLFSSAGHPPAAWYRRHQKSWHWLNEQTPHAMKSVAGLPLGLIHGTDYHQTAVQLAEGDMLILYTDGITECGNEADKELGCEGLLSLLRRMPVEPSIETADALIAAVEEYRGSMQCHDDQSFIVLQADPRASA